MQKWPLFLFIIIIIPTFAASQLDLKEANVTNVSYTKLDGISYSFSVTIYHDDDGEEPNYADAWQVESLNGTLLGIRELLHSHGTVEFTRSGNIDIPESINTVVVRGRDQNHGFGGQVAIINILTSEIELIDQGPEPLDFTDYVFGGEVSVPTIISTTDNTYAISPIFEIFLFVILIGGRKSIRN